MLQFVSRSISDPGFIVSRASNWTQGMTSTIEASLSTFSSTCQASISQTSSRLYDLSSKVISLDTRDLWLSFIEKIFNPKRAFSMFGIERWQINAEIHALNQQWMNQAVVAGRNAISAEKVAAFLNPEIPFSDCFERVKHLGAGAFGSVSLWKDASGQLLAVKELGTQMGEGLADYTHGLNLGHPAIVRIKNFTQKWAGPREMRRYLVMEYIDGKPLPVASPSFFDRVHLAEEMIEGLEHSYEQGILPMDLHSNNGLVTSDGHWKWVDLGLYDLKDHATTTTQSYLTEAQSAVRNFLNHRVHSTLEEQKLLERIAELNIDFRIRAMTEFPSSKEIGTNLLIDYCKTLRKLLSEFSTELQSEVAG